LLDAGILKQRRIFSHVENTCFSTAIHLTRRQGRFPTIIKKVAEMGYVGVELAGFADSLSETQILLEQNNLSIGSILVGRFQSDINNSSTITVIGQRFVVVPISARNCVKRDVTVRLQKR